MHAMVGSASLTQPAATGDVLHVDCQDPLEQRVTGATLNTVRRGGGGGGGGEHSITDTPSGKVCVCVHHTDLIHIFDILVIDVKEKLIQHHVT